MTPHTLARKDGQAAVALWAVTMVVFGAGADRAGFVYDDSAWISGLANIEFRDLWAQMLAYIAGRPLFVFWEYLLLRLVCDPAGRLGALHLIQSGLDRRAAGAALLLWHAGESVAAHPDYLAYFNQIARGREERFLADSNLDWGQDLARLGHYVRGRGIVDLQLSYFGTSSPGRMGLHQGLPCCRQAPGGLAISVNHLLGIPAERHDIGWLRDRKPGARAGKSIWLYFVAPGPP